MHTDCEYTHQRRMMRRALRMMERGPHGDARSHRERGERPAMGPDPRGGSSQGGHPRWANPFGDGGPFGGRFGGGRGQGQGGRGGRGGHGGGGDGEGGSGSGPGAGFGRRRMFRPGELRLVLLHLVSQQPRHGYDLIKAIEELTGGAYAPSPGTIYPTLQLLVDEATLVEMPDEGARKVFAITPAGTQALEQDQALAQAALSRLASLGDERRSGPHRQVARAMDNLRNALAHQRASGIDQARVEQIVDLIDEAARKIERL